MSNSSHPCDLPDPKERARAYLREAYNRAKGDPSTLLMYYTSATQVSAIIYLGDQG
jgi:hypothetical protein